MSMAMYDMINYNFPIGSKFDNNHQIPNADLRSSSFGAIDTTSYEDIMKELSDVELQPYPTLEKLGMDDYNELLNQRKRRKYLAAQAHNMCERRHRNRINVRMRALQELIPHCPKRITKASILEHAIEYIQTLQHQARELSIMGGYACFNMFQTPFGLMASSNSQIMQPLTSNVTRLPIPNYSTNIG